MMIRRLLLAFLLPVVLIASCSLPTDERADVYDRDDLPPAIANTTTTTSTTTTSVPISVDTSGVPDATAVTTVATTTTMPPTATAPVDLYYTIGLSNDLVRLRQDLNEDASIGQVLQQLEQPSPDLDGFGLRSAVRSGLVDADRIVLERGTATIPLNPVVADLLSEPVLRRAIAQIVLTLTSFSTFDAGSIASIVFEVDGEGFPVFVPAFGGVSEQGEKLFFEDFAPVISTTTGGTATSTTTPSNASTTTTTSTTTTVQDIASSDRPADDQ